MPADRFTCPVCSADAWERVGEYRYRAADADAEWLTPYQQLRWRILFEVWFPGADEVRLGSMLCAECGFVSYGPRPTTDEIDAKYRFLQVHEQDIGGSAASARGRELDALRAAATLDAVRRHAPARRLRVLDFGGGDGKLLEPFVAEGHEGFLVDYNVEPRAGVAKLGDTLDDVDPDRRFDAIVCSHVLEHLAEPRAVLRALAERLEPDGVLFGEVPAEVWRGIPIARDPVTHVNFFTPGSFRRLFEGSGLRPYDVRRTRGSYGQNRKDVIVAVAARGAAAPSSRRSVRETRRLLEPSLPMRVHHVVRARRLPHVSRQRGAVHA